MGMGMGMGMGTERVLPPAPPGCFVSWWRRLPLRTPEANRRALIVAVRAQLHQCHTTWLQWRPRRVAPIMPTGGDHHLSRKRSAGHVAVVSPQMLRIAVTCAETPQVP